MEQKAAKEQLGVFSGDPDYEIPEGTLTETKVLLGLNKPMRLDHYGFLQPAGGTATAGRDDTGAAAAAAAVVDSGRDSDRAARRLRKWRKMLGPAGSNFAAYSATRSSKLKRRIRKGIPEQMRGLAWQLLSGGRALLSQNAGRYAALHEGHISVEVDTSILRDLNRTFPNHILFIERQGMGQHSLYNVLRAYAALDPQVGYVQGMGFMAAVLVMYMTGEEAFWTLVALMRGSAARPAVAEMYTAGMPLLQLCLFQFQELLKEELPDLSAHMQQENVEPIMYATFWFNTLFAYTLPAPILVRVWDVFMLEGMRVVFRVGLAILKAAQAKLMAAGFEALAGMLGAKSLPALVPPVEELLEAAFKIHLTERLERFEARYKQGQAQRPPNKQSRKGKTD